jgi:hypothetical protein
MKRKPTKRDLIVDVVQEKLGYKNGWAVSECRYATLCGEAAAKIIRVLRSVERLPRKGK